MADHNAPDCYQAPLIAKILADLEESRREMRADSKEVSDKLSVLSVEISKVQQSAVTGRAMWAGIVVTAGLLGGGGAVIIQKMLASAPAAIPAITQAIK
jgi:hypothetical protein